jgi:hypothetical protein
MKHLVVLATILLIVIAITAVSQPVRAISKSRESFLKQQNVTKAHLPERGSVGKGERCDFVKCGEAIVGCAEKCGKDLASLDCIECLGPLYESCKTCF